MIKKGMPRGSESRKQVRGRGSDGNDHHIRLLFESAVRQGLIAGIQDDVGFHLDAEFLAHVDLGQHAESFSLERLFHMLDGSIIGKLQACAEAEGCLPHISVLQPTFSFRSFLTALRPAFPAA
jgi:hypothetical protein